mmetsp:Transcript_19156/g.39475  ORF Transcript_19156/g.39475 Transcript_19156/m.39475 type:complete len:84 (-) Transcript_19156:295-546(-)
MSGIDGWHHHGSFWGRHFHIQLLEMLHDVALPSILTYDRQFRPFFRKKKLSLSGKLSLSSIAASSLVSGDGSMNVRKIMMESF